MNILEKDIEDALFANPYLVPVGCITGRTCYTSLGWIARQYSVPSGRIDLLGLLQCDHPWFDMPRHRPTGPTYHPLIVELKRGKIDAAAVAQVGRYLFDIREVIEEIELTYGVAPTTRAMFPVIIGQSVDNATLRSAIGFGVTLLGYNLEPFTVDTQFSLSREECGRDRGEIMRLIDAPPFTSWRQEAARDRRAMGWPAEAVR